ncbi:Type I Iterative PKS [Apiospora arundinis]|uniref:Type I Iterative PKS n=1 Tax=Apiospora arundinis TaxID=335852 RepID=A0ABR2I9R9_9PEZI
MALKDTQNLPKYHLTGNAPSIEANRISYVFDLKGPSVSLNTACSGGLVALHQACQSLKSGESGLAIVGGSNLILTPDFMFGMSFMGYPMWVWNRGRLLFVLTAKSKTSLKENVSYLRNWITNNTHEFRLDDLSHTLANRRTPMSWRSSWVASRKEDLPTATRDAPLTKVASSKRPVVFLFTGQGAQWYAMGRELLATQGRFRDSIRESDRILQKLGIAWSLRDELSKPKHLSRIDRSEIAQPASIAVQIALVDLLRSLGVAPDAVLGHSSGEMAAAYAAGALTHEQTLILSDRRSLISSWCDEEIEAKGAMLAAGLGEKEVLLYLKRIPHECGLVNVACVNSPFSTTISGDKIAIHALKESLDSTSTFARVLKVDTAYHSHHMKVVAPRYREKIGYLETSAPPKSIRFFSSVTAKEKLSDFGTDYWVENLVSKVRFSDGLGTLCNALRQQYNGPVSPIFVELGPHPALSGPTRQTITSLKIADFDYAYTSPLSRDKDARKTVLEMAGKLFQHGCAVDITAANQSILPMEEPHADNIIAKIRPVVVKDLPTYAWDHSKTYWHESRLSRDYRLRPYPHHDLLGLRIIPGNDIDPTWRNLLSIDRMPWLRDHVVDDFVIFPGSGYMCMAIEAMWQLAQGNGTSTRVESFKLRDIEFIKALVVPEPPETVEIQLALHAPAKARDTLGAWRQFVVAALSPEGHWAEQCRGSIMIEYRNGYGDEEEDMETAHETASHAAGRVEWYRDVATRCSASLSPDALYDAMRQNGNHYGDTFASITDIRLGDHVAHAIISTPDVPSVMPARSMQPHHIHPTTLDTIAHASLPVHARHYKTGAVMPIRIGELTVQANMPNQPRQQLSACVELVPLGAHSATADTVVFADGVADLSRPCVTISDLELVVIGESKSSGVSGAGPLPALHTDWVEDKELFLNQVEVSVVKQQHNGTVNGVNGHGTSHQPRRPPVEFLALHPDMTHLVDKLQGVLNGTDVETSTSSFPVESVSSDKVYVLLDNASDPILDNTQPHRFQELGAFLMKAKSVLWVTMAAKAGEEPGPNVHLVTGFTRVARRENEGMRLVSVLVPHSHEEAEYPQILQTVGRVIAVNFGRFQAEEEEVEDGFYECEYMYRDRKIWVPRLAPAEPYERWVRAKSGQTPPTEMTPFNGGCDLVLEIERPGLLNSMRFVPLARGPLGPCEVEIQPDCYAVTRTDAFLAGGGTDARLAPSAGVVGTIAAVGSDVQDTWHVGDRVVGFAAQAISNRPRVSSVLVRRFSDTSSFSSAQVASALYPLISAAYAFTELTSVGTSHSVLVHGADSECGQAAVGLARHLGAEVFATVHDAAAGKRLLVESLGLPADHVFSLRAGTYRDQIHRLTRERGGVQVALNCSGLDVFRDTWACMADFGILVDMVQPGGAVCSTPSHKHATYVSFDLGTVIRHRPELVGRLIDNIISLLDQKQIKSGFSSLTTKPITEAHDAIRQVQAGKASVSTVLEIHPDALVKSAIPPNVEETRLVEDGTYVIAGGLGDIGQGMCRLLAARGARHIVILSRSGASRDPEKKELLEKDLAVSGAHLYAIACDVTDVDQVVAAARWVEANNLPPVRGVIQSAAILRDRMLEAMDLETFRSALGPKQEGTLNLIQCFRSTSLSFFIMLASAISALGTKGQANYAAGNTFQEGLALWKKKGIFDEATHAVAINPGLVAGTDADLYSPERRQILAKQGLATVPFASVMSAIEYAMSAQARADGLAQVILGLDADLLVKHDAALHNRIYAMILHTAKEQNNNNTTTAAARSLVQQISAAESRGEVHTVVQDALTGKLVELLAMDPGDVRVHVPMADFGLDSLVAIELKNWVFRSFKAAMQTADVLEAASLVALATAILERSSLVPLKAIETNGFHSS